MRVDTHNHVIPEQVLDLLDREPAFGVTIQGDRWHGGNHVDFELAPSFSDPGAKLAELDALGMDAAIVSVAPPLFYYEIDVDIALPLCSAAKEGMEEFCSRSPERLSWMAHLPMQSPELAVEAMEEAAGSDGCVGIEVGSSVAGRRLDSPEFDAFWAAAGRLGLPVMIHPDATYDPHPGLAPYYLGNVIGLPLETTLTIERLICGGVLDRHPDVDVLLVHAGGFFPYQAGRLRHARRVRPELADSPDDPWAYRLWFDCITHDHAALSFLVAIAGLDRIVLGSDKPFDMAPPDPLGAVVTAVGREAAEEIARRNPARLYFD